MSGEPYDGGPAHPCEMDRYGDRNEGMSLRDYFAAQALVSMGMWCPGATWPEPEEARRLRAQWSYAQADAMLEARKDR